MVASAIASHMVMTGHMPMFTQKLSNIFHFFDLDQISDMCSFDVSIGFLPSLELSGSNNICSEGLKKNPSTFDEVISQNVQFSNFQNFICSCMSALLS